MRGKVLIVAHDDAQSIGPVLQEVDEARLVLERSGVMLDVLLVDEGSDDATIDLAVAEAEQLGLQLDVSKSALPGALGALRLGLEQTATATGYGFVVTLDGDGQHDARQIPDLVRAHIAGGRDITIGSRWARGGSAPGTPAARAAASRLGNLSLRLACRLDGVRDATSGFRVMNPEVGTLAVPADACGNPATFFASLTVIAQASGFAVGEVPIGFRPRYSGVRGLPSSDARRFARGLLATRRAVSGIRSELRHDQTAWAKRQHAFSGQEPATDSHFGALAELEALSDAKNFFGWIADGFAGAVGANTVEVGAGLGTVSLSLTERYATNVLALEPAANVFPRLAERVRSHARITARQTTSGAVLAEGREGTFDTAVYVNVLEHIEDDSGELDVARRLLTHGGHLCLFVPAMPSLYSPIDHKSGHYRRYTKAALRRKVEDAGFVIERIDYFDAASIVPYWLMYRVLGVEDLGSGSNTFYNRVIVPISRLVQRVLVHPPIGKNLIVVARRVR